MSRAHQQSHVVFIHPERTQRYIQPVPEAPPPPARKPVRLLAPLGWTLILLSLIFNIWTVEALFVPAGGLAWPDTFYVYLLQVCMATAGAILLLVHCNYKAVMEILGKQD